MMEIALMNKTHRILFSEVAVCDRLSYLRGYWAGIFGLLLYFGLFWGKAIGLWILSGGGAGIVGWGFEVVKAWLIILLGGFEMKQTG
jgi:hypothetical protein